MLTGRVQTKKKAPLSEAKISLAETPYNVLAQTNARGFFIAFNVCADANQKMLITREGFVPVKIKATILTSTTANLKATLENAGILSMLRNQLIVCPTVTEGRSYFRTREKC